MMAEKLDLRGSSLEELQDFCRSNGLQAFRAKQIADWVYGKSVISLAEMTNIAAGQRELLGKLAFLPAMESLAVKTASDGTTKFLWRLEDKNTLETVLLPYTEQEQAKNRYTVCMSTQIGCPMGCTFCATGKQGFVRNMTVGEIVSQVILINRYLYPKKVSNLVVMGMGEPLLNYDRTLKALRLLHSFLDISWRRITLSTCGLVPKIKQLAGEELPLVLAVSLHAPNDRLRSQLMPVNRKYPLGELLAACVYYQEKTGRRISFEYALLAGVNDSPKEAGELVELLKPLNCHVNLIPVNPHSGSGYSCPSRKAVRQFKELLEKSCLPVSVREEKGREIMAACGQLRQKEAERNEASG